MNLNEGLGHEERIEKYARSSEHLSDVKKGLERIAEYIEKGVILDSIEELDETVKGLLEESILCMIRYGREDLSYLKKLSKGTMENGDLEFYSGLNFLISKLEAERDNHMSYSERIRKYFKNKLNRVFRIGSFHEDYADWKFRKGFVNAIKSFIDHQK